jgi:hypothetical protein
MAVLWHRILSFPSHSLIVLSRSIRYVYNVLNLDAIWSGNFATFQHTYTLKISDKDVLFLRLQTFCPSGRLVSTDILSFWMVCPTEVLSPNFMPLGVLSPEVCPSGRFVSECFVWVPNKQLDYSLPAVRLPCNVPAIGLYFTSRCFAANSFFIVYNSWIMVSRQLIYGVWTTGIWWSSCYIFVSQ